MADASDKEQPPEPQEPFKKNVREEIVDVVATDAVDTIVDKEDAGPPSSSSVVEASRDEELATSQDGLHNFVLPDVSSTKADDGIQLVETKVTKNQLKRQRKWEQKMEVKRRRKEQEKNIKLARAKAEGRNIDAERIDMEERRKDGKGWARRDAAWKERFERDSSKYQICLDCSFEELMTEREVNSLALQIRYCYATNKKADHPVKVTVSSLSGETLDQLCKVSGFEHWTNRSFCHTANSVDDTYPEKSKLVYLTSDSEAVLEKLEDDHVYIIGGIVDRNRLKRAAIDRAEALGIATARLPIDNYFSMVTTKVLTCNHVFDILIKFRQNGDDWKKAFLDVLPGRKAATEKGAAEEKGTVPDEVENAQAAEESEKDQHAEGS
jgi:tRNA (guanine9-N1)-methyltransferase